MSAGPPTGAGILAAAPGGAPRESAGSDPPARPGVVNTVAALLEGFVAAVRERTANPAYTPPAQVRRRLDREIGGLLADRVPPDAIAGGLRLLAGRPDLGPGVLPNLVDAALRTPTTRGASAGGGEVGRRVAANGEAGANPRQQATAALAAGLEPADLARLFATPRPGRARSAPALAGRTEQPR